ncbi:MAG: flavin reductase [Selenomonas ruminantium]|nr:flavin reductase [Selenomonas ruminantium]
MNPKAMFNISYGLYVLTANLDGKDNGCIINTVTQVTSDPNQITIAVNKANYTRDMIAQSKKFTASIISQQADFELFKRFGFQSGKTTDKFAGFSATRRLPNEALLITEGTNAYISGYVTQEIDLGTHSLFIASVTDMDVLNDTPAATYTYYHQHIKPKPQAAPKKEGKTIWRCTICGYEYEGDELPADFICPICKHPASDFEKV